MAYKKLQVVVVKKEANEVLSIQFKTLGGNPIAYKAGQFITLVFNVNGKELRRSYSLYSSPDVDEDLAIAVKLVENGEISRFIHHQIAVGDIVNFSDVNGLFIYLPESDIERTVFLFGAGVGVTPLFAMLKTALLKEQKSKMVLVYSNRSKEDIVFQEELEQWQIKYPNRLKIIYLLSDSKNLMRARLNGFLINQLVKQELQFSQSEALFYTCGPVDYMDVCKFTLLGMGFTAAQIKRETFVLPEDELDEDDSTEKVIDTNTYSVLLDFYGEKYELDIPYNKRILEVALAHKIPLPYSCSGGVCSTCIASCTKGNVRMDYNEVLTDQEIAAGRILVCTGHPTENGTTIVWK